MMREVSGHTYDDNKNGHGTIYQTIREADGISYEGYGGSGKR
jgi:hypothetical protein